MKKTAYIILVLLILFILTGVSLFAGNVDLKTVGQKEFEKVIVNDINTQNGEDNYFDIGEKVLSTEEKESIVGEAFSDFSDGANYATRKIKEGDIKKITKISTDSETYERTNGIDIEGGGGISKNIISFWVKVRKWFKKTFTKSESVQIIEVYMVGYEA